MRTVRSAAQARNRPKEGLGCLLIVVVAVLVALAARAAAEGAPEDEDDADEADMTLSANRADPDDAEQLLGAVLGTSGELVADDPLALDLEDAGLVADAGSSASAISSTRSALQPELDLEDAAGSADPTELLDAKLRDQRPSWWGRLDVAITWRRSFNHDDASTPSHRDSLWLLAIWRL